MVNNLSNEIANALQEYTTEVEEGLEKAKKTEAQAGARKLRRISPKKTGEYARGWSARKMGTGYVIHNRTRWMLAHLLEKGYAKVGGGRVPGRPHIRPVEEEVIRNYEKRVEKVIRG